MEEKPDGFSRIGSAISGFFAVIARFFAEFATAMAKGDLFVKLTLVWWGAGYLRRKQYVKALLMTLLEAAVILFTVNFAMNYVPKFGTLGTVQAEQVFRVYLKTVNMPKQRVFSACCTPFFLAIHKVFLRKNGFIRRKIPRCWSYSRFPDRP